MLIYKITNNINDKIYIGLFSAKKPFENYWGSGHIIKKAIKKYGKENFSKIILEDNIETREKLWEREKYYIALYNSTDPEVGYNITNGGEGVSMKMSDQTKEKIGLKTKIRLANKENHPRFGKKTSPELVEKLKIVQKQVALDRRRNQIEFCNKNLAEEFKVLAQNKTTKKDMLKLYSNLNIAKDTLTDVYREIFIQVNGYSLISRPKDKANIEKGVQTRIKNGKKLSSDALQKMSERSKGNRNPMYGTTFVFMYLGKVNKRVKPEEVETHLTQGWIKGKYEDAFICSICNRIETKSRLKTHSNKCVGASFTITDEKYISKSRNKNPVLNRLKGSNNHKAKLTENQVLEILQLLKEKTPVKSIMQKYNVGESTIYSIKTGKSWKHLKAFRFFEREGVQLTEGIVDIETQEAENEQAS